MRVNVIAWRRSAATLVFVGALVPISSSAYLNESRSNAPPGGAAPRPTSIAETSAALAAFGYKPAAEPDGPVYVERPPERARKRDGIENQARKLWRGGDAGAAL